MSYSKGNTSFLRYYPWFDFTAGFVLLFSFTVTESEIRHGVLCEPEDTCFWISRNILDLKDHLLDENAQAFIDINSSTQEIDSDAQELLEVKIRTRCFSRISLDPRKSVDRYWL